MRSRGKQCVMSHWADRPSTEWHPDVPVWGGLGVWFAAERHLEHDNAGISWTDFRRPPSNRWRKRLKESSKLRWFSRVRGRLLGAGAWFKWSGGACSVQVPVSIVKGVLAGAGACLK
jgi:hypothetical protein